MTGSLQEKNNKYYFVLNIYEGGKRKQKWISTGLSVRGNKKKAEEMMRKVIHDYELQSSLPHLTCFDILMSKKQAVAE